MPAHRILVVPESVDLDFRKTFLERSSFEFRRATCGSEALAAAAIWHPHLVLFSSHLGDMSPAGFCEALRGTAATADTRLLMLTDQYGSESTSELQRTRCHAHLLEPIDEAQLMRAIGGLLDLRMRRGPRADVEWLAQIEQTAGGEDEPETIMANILSVSETGMLLECESHLVLGGIIDVHFFVPDEPARLSAKSEVLYGDELKLHYGVEITKIDPGARGVIRAFVQGELGQGGQTPGIGEVR